MLRSRLAVAAIVTVAGVLLIGILVAHAGEAPESPQGEASETPRYVGAKKCRLCHLKQHKTWKQSQHASNFDALIGPERSDPDCVRCHVTGFGKPGGFVSEEETPGLTNVGCESCHGPGSVHVKVAKNAPDTGEWDTRVDRVPQNACVQCHNPHINQKERAEKLRQSHEAGE